MKKTYKIYLAAAFTIATSLTACKKTLEIQPVDSVDAAFALSSKEGIEATVISMYASLKPEAQYGNRQIGLGEALADNAVATNKSGRYVNEAANIAGNHYSQWSSSYNVINRINLVLETLPNLTVAGFTQAQKDAYVGEVKFLRALYYFDLVKEYAYIPGATVATQDKGGVPLILKSTGTITDAQTISSPRASIDAVYTQIYADLDDAMAKIPNSATNVVRATRLGAEALYSRVALYRKDYAKCITLSSDVIANTTHPLLTATNYVSAFRQPVNPESLFEVAFTAPNESLGVNVSLQTLFTTLKTPGDRSQKAGFGDLVPSASFLAAIGITVTGNGSTTAAITARSSDVRNQLYELGAGSPYYVECTKFIGRSSSVNLDNVPVIRTSEMYLNRAEAYAALGTNDLAAAADVNAIRTNRGLTATVGLTGTALLNEILLQRRIELGFEGHRFLDLKRRGQDIVKPNGTTVAFTDRVILPAIPQTDVDGSLGTLVQNFGY